MYDIIFISYKEPNAEENWKSLKERFPTAQRVHGVKGIHLAHVQAARKSLTKMFWVVDGDARITSDFDFRYTVEDYDLDAVHVCQSMNPINGLVYGYGGVKLLPRDLTLQMDLTKADMTTSISDKFNVIEKLSNVTAFNTDEFNTWKSAFRECVKLASRTIDRQDDDETENRLRVWTTVGDYQPYGEYAIKGAIAGKEYGLSNKDNPLALKMINNFDWLEEQFAKEA
jgi:hypothetical protein